MASAKYFQQHQLCCAGPPPSIFSNNLRNAGLEEKQPLPRPPKAGKTVSQRPSFSLLRFDMFWIMKLCFHPSPYKVCRQIFVFSWNDKHVAWGKFFNFCVLHPLPEYS